MINTLYLPELREMLELGDVDGLREFCIALHPARTAEFMEGLTAAESWTVLRPPIRPRASKSSAISTAKSRSKSSRRATRRASATLIADMPADDRVDLLNAVDEEVARELLSLVPSRQAARHPAPAGVPGRHRRRRDDDRSGPAARDRSPSARALEELSRIAENLETIYYIYIVDDDNHLRGAVSARQLVTHLNQPKMPITELMERNLVTVEATDDQEAVAAKVADYDFLAIPVVDHEQHLVGIITHDDVIDVLQQEATEDAYLAGAVGPHRRRLPVDSLV